MDTNTLSFVDVETTGSRITYDRVIEIGIVRVEKGKIKKKYTTLINPHCHVSPFIEQITGIHADELNDAPVFEHVAQEIYDILSDSILVAHNVRFDYGFLKNEFRRLGIQLSLRHFCSVKLSRLLFPEEKHHNLDRIIERFNFSCKRRHRAYDDAKVIWDFYKKVHLMFPKDLLESHLEKLLKKPTLPRFLSEKDINELPESPGIYIFYGENEIPLYVGKSVNIRDRVLSHFSSDYTNTKEMNMCQQIERIETTVTAGELGALLKETRLIKELQPIYNRQLRLNRELYFLKRHITPDGYQAVSLELGQEITDLAESDILGIFRSRKQAKDHLSNLVKEFGLCEKLLGLNKGRGPCFSSKLGYCKGACSKKEIPIKYNLRMIEAFGKTKIKTWPFEGTIVIREIDQYSSRTDEFIVNKWRLVEDENNIPFDYDTYKILVRYILNEKNMKHINTQKQSITLTEPPSEFVSDYL